jgi:hypothetical protein
MRDRRTPTRLILCPSRRAWKRTLDEGPTNQKLKAAPGKSDSRPMQAVAQTEKAPLLPMQSDCQLRRTRDSFVNRTVLNISGRSKPSRASDDQPRSGGPISPRWWFSARGVVRAGPPVAGTSRTPVYRARRLRRRQNLGRNSYSFLRFNIGNGHNVPFGGELESIAMDSLWKRFGLGHGVRLSLAAGVHCDTVGQGAEPRHEPLSG